ncbi:MAG: AbrB/MazE/SpoVT family DNA-binding domain-containing protein [Chloroflexi bacterium]|nr:AbrB/MazE/SpoVT family DNA-binding domain-containing protein [Chloroflexota bacterium]
MKEFLSSVSPKGQITLPVEVRRRLGIKPKDQVVIDLEQDSVRIRPAPRQSFLDSYRTIPALPRRLSVEEMTEIAAEEHAEEAAREGF